MDRTGFRREGDVQICDGQDGFGHVHTSVSVDEAASTDASGRSALPCTTN
ncbi:hypothetical protein FM106_17300 [Brachybacterium faecium]|nr:hypothetical protein FM106_17300 [Brachybacterium faecium]